MTDTQSTTQHSIAVVEQAKGALMLRYGVSSGASLAALSRWADEARVTVPDVAHVLVTGICQGHVTPQNRVTVRWLEQRLREGITDVTRETDGTHLGGSSEQTRRTPTRSAANAAVAAARRWRYQSAVHAARALANL